jgi:hypothetical protein
MFEQGLCLFSLGDAVFEFVDFLLRVSSPCRFPPVGRA